MKKLEYERYKAAVERNLKGCEFVSTGACPGCDTCGLDEDCSEQDRQMAEEGGFSSSECDCCGSSLGGNRYPAHWCEGANGPIHHMEICQDCLYFLEYGQLDDQTMLDMEDEESEEE